MKTDEYSTTTQDKMPTEMPANDEITALTSSMNTMQIDVIGRHDQVDEFDEEEVDSDFSDYGELDDIELPPSVKHKKLTSL